MGNLRKFLGKKKDKVVDLGDEEFGRHCRRVDAYFCQQCFKGGHSVQEVIAELPKQSPYAKRRGEGYVGRIVRRAWRAFCREHNLIIDDSFKLKPDEAIYLDMSNRSALADSMTVEAGLLLLSNAVSNLLFLGWSSDEVGAKVGRYCRLIESYKENQQALLQAVEVGQISRADYAKKLAGSGGSVIDFMKRDDDIDPVVERTRTDFERCVCDEHRDD